jgi:hypothetical protein
MRALSYPRLLFAATFICMGICVLLRNIMIRAVNKLAPPKSSGLRNLYDATRTSRVIPEYMRLYPASKLPNLYKTCWALSLLFAFLCIASLVVLPLVHK